MAQVFVSIGSNIDAENNIRFAVKALRESYGNLSISSVYESEAVGFEGDNFLNLVVGLQTELDVKQVVASFQHIEDACGRTRLGPRFSARTLDLDLLMYNDLVLADNRLVLPREEILENAFVLWPLAEIAPNVIHPTTGISLGELWKKYDKSAQRLWPIEFAWS